MEKTDNLHSNRPVGIVDSLGKGFSTVISRSTLLSVPLLLDCFLWLGPRLRASDLVLGAFEILGLPVQPDNSMEPGSLAGLDTESLSEALNLFSFLSTSPLGVPSMIVNKMILNTPFGQGLEFSIGTWGSFAIVVIVLTLIGLLLGAVYFSMIAEGVENEDRDIDHDEIIVNILQGWFKIVAFGVLLIVGMFGVGFAVSLIASVASILHPAIGGFVISVGVAVWVWGLCFVAFSIHGFVMNKLSLIDGIKSSVQLVRNNMSAVIGLFGVGFLIVLGLGYLWTIPAGDSWLLFIGITAHAFVLTGIYASTFHFYKDRFRWNENDADNQTKI
ncbi:MAG: hypothetical protein CMQ51_00855 [Gammaproteobacteria bacterium]|nr:hypothetical protein [Gammaproteobacteria bacterium]